jgi:hypothetical protein
MGRYALVSIPLRQLVQELPRQIHAVYPRVGHLAKEALKLQPRATTDIQSVRRGLVGPPNRSEDTLASPQCAPVSLVGWPRPLQRYMTDLNVATIRDSAPCSRTRQDFQPKALGSCPLFDLPRQHHLQPVRLARLGGLNVKTNFLPY